MDLLRRVCRELVSLFSGLLIYAIAITVLIILIAAYVLWFENPPIVFHNAPFSTNKAEYHRGEQVNIYGEGVRYTNAPVERFADFRDGIIIAVPPIFRPGTKPGEFAHWLPATKVPDDLPSGKWQYCAKSVYFVGPLGLRRTVDWCTQSFMIVDD